MLLINYILFGALLLSLPVLLFTGWTDVHSFIFISYAIAWIATVIIRKIMLNIVITQARKEGLSDFEISLMMRQYGL